MNHFVLSQWQTRATGRLLYLSTSIIMFGSPLTFILFLLHSGYFGHCESTLYLPTECHELHFSAMFFSSDGPPKTCTFCLQTSLWFPIGNQQIVRPLIAFAKFRSPGLHKDLWQKKFYGPAWEKRPMTNEFHISMRSFKNQETCLGRKSIRIVWTTAWRPKKIFGSRSFWLFYELIFSSRRSFRSTEVLCMMYLGTSWNKLQFSLISFRQLRSWNWVTQQYDYFKRHVMFLV